MGQRMSRRFLGVSALIFTASVVITVYWCASMSAMGEMPMPGGWSMSMMWMRMPGQSWPGAATSFLGMWVVMMMAMMLPSLTPMLSRFREAVAATAGTRPVQLTILVAVGYSFVWAVLGLMIFIVGASFSVLEMQFTALARTAPILAGLVVLAAGALQLTRWKARRLACCRSTPQGSCRFPANPTSAWRYGLRIGIQCSYCCAGFTAILLVIGVMDLRAMAVVTAAISLERLLPGGERVARATGVVVFAAGFILLLRPLVTVPSL